MDWGFLLGGASGRRIPATWGGAHGGRAALEETNGDRRSASGRSAGNRTTEGGDDSASTAGRRGSSRRLCSVFAVLALGPSRRCCVCCIQFLV